MRTISIDIETYSSTDISLGVHKYTEADDFSILLFAYKIDEDPIKIIDLTEEEIPEFLINALVDKNVDKWAFNAMFERVCLDNYLNIKSCNWKCSQIRSWSLGLEGGLDVVSRAMGIDEDKEKMKIGKDLIKKFSKPQKKKPYRITKKDDPEAWELFKEYCKRDVEVETYIRSKLNEFEYLDDEQRLYELDQKINDAGILIDADMAKNAIKINNEGTSRVIKEFNDITGIDKPTKVAQLKDWLNKRTKHTIDSLAKGLKDELFQIFKDDPDAKRALECRFYTNKTSIKKYETMLDVMCKDGRSRGNIQFYGAQRTGRWAGRLIQVHNLPKNHVADLDNAVNIVKYGDYDLLSMCYSDPPDILTQCIRPCVIPPKNNRFAVADFSAIEARVVAWLAGEDWVLDVFKTTGKIYEAAASRMFNIPLESITKGSAERQKGKVATLALGYQGAQGALVSMGALKMGIPEEELGSIVSMWRKANPNIVNLWYRVDKCVIDTIKTKRVMRINKYLSCGYKNGYLWIKLPSGRKIYYPKPSIGQGPYGEVVQYGKFKSRKWAVKDTFGGSLVENIVQATARDCLAHAMLALDDAGYKIVMHVHDEVVIEVDKDNDCLNDIVSVMCQVPKWAKGLPLNADGYYCNYYKKD